VLRGLPGAKANYPVLVWINGGAYSGGDSQQFNGMQHVEASGGDMVWVTVEYRLNVFGFVGLAALRSRDAQGSVGNYGLQDQRLALQWVQKNITSFGGDPGSVTIDGSSAGGGSTANHVVNAHSWPFFHKAAGENGEFAMWNSMPLSDAEQTFSAVLNRTACAAGAGSVDCLEKKTALELLSASDLPLSRSRGGPSRTRWT